MSRNTVYKCDQCQKEIGNKKHISLSFCSYSGIAIPPELLSHWKIVSPQQGTLKHFCNPDCLHKFFKNLYVKAEKELDKESDSF